MRRSVLLLFLTTFLTAQPSPEVEITAEPHHRLVFENAQVRVFNVDVPPHTETLMHWHRHDYIFVTIGAAQIVNAVAGKDPVPLTLPDGDVRFVSAPFAHTFRNISAQPFRNVTIELLQDDQLRSSTFKWDATRGLDILHGGTSEILFVKDAVRVSNFELQPGGMIPMHRHEGPRLLVAITDLELRSDVAGKTPSTIAMKQSEIKWLPASSSQTLTHASEGVAKFITLEFPKQ